MAVTNLLIEFFEKMSSWEEGIVRGSGLSLPQMHTVEILGIHGRLIMKDLASYLGVTTGTLTATIDKLEKKGMIVREPNPDDRRSYLVRLTDEGERVHRVHSDAHKAMTSRCLEGFSSEEEEQFRVLFARFTGNFPEPE